MPPSFCTGICAIIPPVVRQAGLDGVAVCVGGCYDVGTALLHDPGQEQHAVRCEVSPDIRHHADQNIRHDIGSDEIVPPVVQIDLPEQIGTVAGDVGQPAFPDVFPCHAHGGRVDVIGTAYAGTQSGRADGENACARPDVQHLSLIHI